MSEVQIGGPAHTVTVRHDGADLVYVIEKAQKLYEATKPLPRPATGFAGPASDSRGSADAAS